MEKEYLKLFNQSTGKNDRPIFEIAVSSIINTARFYPYLKIFFLVLNINLENFFGEKRIIEICKIFNKATEYVFLIGGINFYNPENFKKNFIKLSFLENHSYSFEQGSLLFYPDLSILDLIANLNVKNVINQINQFSNNTQNYLENQTLSIITKFSKFKKVWYRKLNFSSGF